MDTVAEIKSRLPIEELVRQYCQLTKKGRNFVALCPFHHDTHPSFLVSPDKGICYCFPCQKGGDIFTFYQQIEGVDFIQALKDLAERTGVQLPDKGVEITHKDERDRLRECLQVATSFYAEQLQQSPSAKKYLADRGLTEAEIKNFALGVAPDSFSATYEYLLKKGFSRKEIQTSGLGIQKDLRDEKIYDRFRHRLMFPIHDNQGRLIGFGGRTLGNDDAKYLNSAESPLYHKSQVLFGLHHALKDMRESKRVILVEGYFDVLACHRVGVHDVAGTCGTAITEEHARLLKRYVDKVVLCMDQDRAGRDAAERAFSICAREGLQVEGVVLGQKDPADAYLESPDILKTRLTTDAHPYLDIVCAQIQASDLSSPTVMHESLRRLLPLIQSIQSSAERSLAVRRAASALGMTETSLSDDLRTFEKGQAVAAPAKTQSTGTSALFSSAELTLALFLLYPRNLTLLREMIPPEEEFAAALHAALDQVLAIGQSWTSADLLLTEEQRQRAEILVLYCEENGFADWNESVAIREIRRNCKTANRELLQKKQRGITNQLLEARKKGDSAEEMQLVTQYQQLLQMAKTTARE